MVRDYKPMDESERHALKAKYAKVAGDGRFELLKSSTQFDGPIHHLKDLGMSPSCCRS
jgi:hypothetical protein